MKQRGMGGTILAVGVLVLVATAAARADKVTLTNDREIEAKKVTWRPSAQEYRVEMADGTILPVPKVQVARLQIDKPADFDKAMQLAAARQPDAAIPLLDGLVTSYAMLNWDNEARRALAQIYLAKNDAKKAAAVLDDYLANMPKAEVTTDVQSMYWKALLGADRASTLKKELDTAVAGPNREVAAAAQMMRGSMDRQAGLKEQAFLDYMRIGELFRDVKSVQPEALFRAAELLEEMRDPRADQLRRRLAQEYKDSDWAAKLGGRY